MKAYKIEILVIDHDDLGPDSIRQEIEGTRYANDCIYPRVQAIEERDIGEWSDDHPLNRSSAAASEYKRLFASDRQSKESP